jgi:circadian clock protein KaiB
MAAGKENRPKKPAAVRAAPAGPARRAGPKRRSEAPGKAFVLRLYVTGMTPRSRRAIANLRKICDEYLAGQYDLEIIDIYERPYLARDEQIVAAPTLIKVLPVPLRRFIGDLSNTERVLLGLDLKQVRRR